MKLDRRVRTAAIGLCIALAAGSCNGAGERPQAPASQGWSEQEKGWWYAATQGSRLMPYDWFKALEQPGGDGMFADQAYLAGFGFLAYPGSPTQLPVGFALDRNDDRGLSFSRLRWFGGQGPKERWVGINCSACHTAEIAHQGQRLRVEGGPSLVDFQSFVEAVDAALIETSGNPQKWERFAGRVLAGKDTPANRAMLKAELGKLVAWQARAERLNETPLRYGPARVDAFGHIFNKVALFTGEPEPIVNPSDAPVSYPFLWDIYRHDKLQWNGVAQNARLNLGPGGYLDYGAMGRNTGEVIGVFGDIQVRDRQDLTGYPSSVWADNLNRLENLLAKLKAPAWPAGFFPAAGDEAQVAPRRTAGQALYAQKCQGCHSIPAKDGKPYQVTMVPIRGPEINRTDIWMACNAYTYDAHSGRLTGGKDGYLNGAIIRPVEPVANLLATTVKGALVAKKGQIVREAANTFLGIDRAPVVVGPETEAEDLLEQRRQRCITEDNKLLAYKSRPLDGIWATAPYLHNGSVPTLYDLLLPAGRRPVSFRVGTREYDPVKVGYVTGEAPGNAFVFDTRLRGNSNAGHDYGVGALTDEQRWALVEFMKTL